MIAGEGRTGCCRLFHWTGHRGGAGLARGSAHHRAQPGRQSRHHHQHAGTYTSAGGAFRTVKIAASGVTLDGFTFVATADSAAISNSVAGVSDVTIRNSTFTGYTGRTITTGFSEGAGQATAPAHNWQITGNTIMQAGNDMTAIAVFNGDGATIRDNTVTFADSAIGRRGINIDGDTDVVVKESRLTMSADGASTLAGALATRVKAPWAIQISMSDARASNVSVTKNWITGSCYGVTGLSPGKTCWNQNTVGRYFSTGLIGPMRMCRR